MAKFIPLHDNVLVKVAEQSNMTQSGLYIPHTAGEGVVIEGLVVDVGPGKKEYAMTGEATKQMSVKKGDTILFPKFNSTEVSIDGKKHYIVAEPYILAYAR